MYDWICSPLLFCHGSENMYRLASWRMNETYRTKINFQVFQLFSSKISHSQMTPSCVRKTNQDQEPPTEHRRMSQAWLAKLIISSSVPTSPPQSGGQELPEQPFHAPSSLSPQDFLYPLIEFMFSFAVFSIAHAYKCVWLTLCVHPLC